MTSDEQLLADLEGMRDAHRRLVSRLAALDDGDVDVPSRLPGWTLGHLLTHLARNADSVSRRLEAAARGEVVDQYPGGAAGRAAEIEAGASRPITEVLADVRSSQERIDVAASAMPVGAWDGASRDVEGGFRAARELPLGRWREIEVHHVDLGLGYEPSDWPEAFVARIRPAALADVGRRLPGVEEADPRQVVAWAFGRGDPPPGLPVLRPF